MILSPGPDVAHQLEIQPSATYGVLYLDPPTKFVVRSKKGMGRSAERHYPTMTWPQLHALAGDISRVSKTDCVMLIWTTWPHLLNTLALIEAYGFVYKTCGFDWMKASVSTIDLFPDPKSADMKMGYWTRSNSEVCLLATRGRPRRVKADVRMGIIEPARQHSRKPDCVHGRIERLVAGPYLELFGRTERPGWTVLGNEVGKFKSA